MAEEKPEDDTYVTVPVELKLRAPSVYHQDGEESWHEERSTITDAVIDAAAQKIANQADKKLKEQLDYIIQERVDLVVENVVREHVNKALEDGWQEHTKWGGKTGEKKTLQHLIEERLRVVSSDPFERNKGTLLVRCVDRAVADVLKNELKGVVADAQKKFQNQLDNVLIESLKSSLKRALKL